MHLWRPKWAAPFIEEPVRKGTDDEPYTPLGALILCGITMIGLGFQAGTAVYELSGLVLTILWTIAFLKLALDRPKTAPLMLLPVYLAVFLTQVILLIQKWNLALASASRILQILCGLTSLVAIVLVINMPMRDPTLNHDDISRPFTAPSNELRSPEDNLTFFQWMTVSWMVPLIKLGNKRQLNNEDVWHLAYQFQHRHLHDAFRELKGTVVGRLLRANWIDLALLSTLAIIELCANYSSPILLQRLLQAMEHLKSQKQPAIFYAVMIALVRLVAAQSSVFSLWFGRRCYERSRGEMITMLFEKTLHRKIIGGVPQDDEKVADVETAATADEEARPDIVEGEDIEAGEDQGLLDGSVKAKEQVHSRAVKFVESVTRFLNLKFKKQKKEPEKELPATMGKILNLMRNDVYEVAQRFWEFQRLINKPIGLILSFILVWQLIGWPCLVGVAVVVVAQALNAVFARILVSWEKTRRKATDEKLKQITQYVEAIRHLRWYGWHPTWLARIMDARQKELNLRIVTFCLDTLILFVNTLGSGLLPVAAFWAYTKLAGDELRIDIAFPALQLFGLLQSNLKEIPRLITVILNAYVAVGRINSFMKEPDKVEEETAGLQFGEELETEHASFAWPGRSDTVLRDLTLTFPSGLTVLYGQVASGKSALLQALLGELDLQSGRLIKPNSPVAYCSQTPWLQSMSIRDNILFGMPYDDARYKAVLDACALTADFAGFKHGDLSPIGENGIGLSGGQKARTALARAVYSRADTLLLDDPLSALDQQTAEHIVRNCFRGPLVKGRTIILATHRTDLCLSIAEQSIEIVNGQATVREGGNTKANGSLLSHSVSHQSQDGDRKADKNATEAAAVPEKFEEEEHRASGGVQAKIYWEYIRAGGLIWWFFVILSATMCRLLFVAESWFLKEWGEAYDDKTEQHPMITLNAAQTYMKASDASPISRLFDRFPDPGVNVSPWLIGFLIIVVGEATLLLISEIFMLTVTYTAGKNMFGKIMRSVSQTTFRFYDVTPIGRLMNRLTSDIGTIDAGIADQFLYFAWQAISWVSSVVVIASVAPLFLVFALALTAVFVTIFLRFLPTSQSLRRLEMVSLSPLMSNFGALVEGLMTVRAFCAQEKFQERVIKVTDEFQKMDHFYWTLQAWLMYRFDILSAISTLILTLLAISSGLSPGLTAFVLIAAGKFVQSTHALCQQYGHLQLDFVAVERVVELLHLEQEPSGETAPPASWPTIKDDVVFENVTIRYAPEMEPALSNISFTLPGGSNTAVIGRTGSGKSTLALALLATITPESGRILIGGIDISKADRQTLRTRITFLAQDPVLFPGSLRHNLDPTDEHSDEACAEVLERVCGAYNFTLDTEIDSGGKNLSQGQRQLVGLARAILRRSSIVIMDEATASIDRATAWEIQRVLREEMVGSTVITIAHRPSAVRGAEICLKLANGVLVAQGTPSEVVPEDSERANGSADHEDAI